MVQRITILNCLLFLTSSVCFGDLCPKGVNGQYYGGVQCTTPTYEIPLMGVTKIGDAEYKFNEGWRSQNVVKIACKSAGSGTKLLVQHKAKDGREVLAEYEQTSLQTCQSMAAEIAQSVPGTLKLSQPDARGFKIDSYTFVQFDK